MNYKQMLTPNDIRNASSDVDSLSKTEIFDVLRNQRRQCTLYYLKRHADGGTVDLSELVDYVVAWESGTTVQETEPAARKRVYNALRQTHLPRLADVGIVEYDRQTNRVELTDAAREAQLYLEYAPENDIPWHGYYLGLSAVTVLLTIAVGIGIYPFGSLSGFVVAAIVIAAFALSSIVHLYHARTTELEASDLFALEDA